MSKASRRNNQERQDAARDVVERARSGDQVAMGILAMVRDNAKKGDPKAQQAFRAVERYISKNPPNTIGAEGSDITNPNASKAIQALWSNPTNETVVAVLPMVGFWPGVVAMAHGPRLDDTRLNGISESIPEEAREEFKGGVRFWQKKAPGDFDDRNWLLGRIIGLARCLQRLQIPSVPIASFCPFTAWELGE